MEPLQDQDQTDRDVGLLLTEVLDEIDRGPQQGRHPTSTSSTQHNYYQCPVSQTNISNASNVSVGDLAHRGCLSQENLTTRIDNLKKEFIHVHALEVAEELLKKNRHIAINGAPGDGKTSIALMLCDTYLKKSHSVLFVENVDHFDVNLIIKRNNDMLVVFDDMFGSVTLPSSLEAIHKVFSALVESLCVLSVSQPDKITSGQTFKLHFLFTSRTNNWNEGCSRLHQFKGSLFSSQVVVDLTKTGLSEKEKESILTSFMRGNSHFDISQEDMKAITQIQNSMFGFPLTCRLYVQNTVFHMKTRDFFQHPVTYLRGDLDNIVREQSSRSFALILLILCGGKLDLVSFQLGTRGAYTALFHAVQEVVPLCTPTDIGNEIRNFIGSYCRVENNVASFSHPSIYDAAACALGQNEVLKELVRLGANLSLTDNKGFTQQLTTPPITLGNTQDMDQSSQLNISGSQSQVSVDPNSTSWVKTLFDQMRHLASMVHYVQQKVQRVDSIDDKLTMIDGKLTLLENNLQQTITRGTIGRDVDDIYYDVDSPYQQQRDMKEAVVDLKVSLMRDNLLFHGIPEMIGEEPKDIIKDFVKRKMKCNTEINLVRVHRMGPRDGTF
ncbi:uncharacterized protein LOC125379938 [Haliotis rufescens]|uniref:uncharacterized protein LOC125379938 n=1 Tax=Haliotis rufescens TaxID=6454 RepID=UPI00201EE9F1|nr:uncharacterized protein LOC125379938 [Haliotis rufescens]